MNDKSLTNRDDAIHSLIQRERNKVRHRLKRAMVRQGLVGIDDGKKEEKESHKREMMDTKMKIEVAANTEDPSDLSKIYNNETVKRAVKEIVKKSKVKLSKDDILYEKIKASQRMRLEMQKKRLLKVSGGPGRASSGRFS